MEEDVTVRLGMPLVGPESMGKASPQGRAFSPWERERRSVFFVGVEVKGYEEEGVDKTKQGKGVCPDAYGILTVTRGGLTMCLTKPGGQTDCLGWSDRWLLILLIKLYLLWNNPRS
jgi:hypothetical protein